MDVIQVAMTGIVGVLLAIQFKSGKSEYGIYIVTGVSVLIFFGILGQFSVISDAVFEMGTFLNLDASYLQTLMKMIGITYVSEFASAICKDAGYQTIAVQIEIFAKIMILLFCIPVLSMVMEKIGGFL
ncbi:MAG: SpoIIIAC/SpoIIIAD family protein [Eubacteriales bacterium]|nr:SpoIIIAC/SpoIIIAD family protein [Eubacteriales bacterium]